jgi:hypothetical protein
VRFGRQRWSRYTGCIFVGHSIFHCQLQTSSALTPAEVFWLQDIHSHFMIWITLACGRTLSVCGGRLVETSRDLIARHGVKGTKGGTEVSPFLFPSWQDSCESRGIKEGNRSTMKQSEQLVFWYPGYHPFLPKGSLLRPIYASFLGSCHQDLQLPNGEAKSTHAAVDISVRASWVEGFLRCPGWCWEHYRCLAILN